MESKILNALGIDPAFIFLFMLILFVVLFILYVNVTMKYNRLKNSYATFMKGKDGKSLEQSLKDKFRLKDFNKKTYHDYMTYGWQSNVGTDEKKQNKKFISSFLDIYENSEWR